MRVALLFVLGFAACGSGAGDLPITQARFRTGVDHPYFPLATGVLRVYAGEAAGQQRREEVCTMDEPCDVLGVACTAVEQMQFLDGELAELTTEWFAQDHLGNVWKFGERTLVPALVGLVESEDSWQAGVDGAWPWIAFPADPQVGTHYSGFRPGGRDEFFVTALDAAAAVPAGTFHHCMELVENPGDPDDRDIILYAPGIGRVAQREPDGAVELVEVRRH